MWLTGNIGDDTLDGGDGSDLIRSGAGVDTIIGGSEALGWTVVAEEDEVHYADRYPGEMHPQTEEALRHGYE